MIKKIVNFGLVGVIATAIEYILLIILKEIFKIDVLIASGIAFTISLLFNYILSIKYVFVDKKEMSKAKEMTGFFITALIGLGINQLMMYVLVDLVSIYYLFAKVISTGIVMVWNFVSRHLFLEKGKK